MKLMLVTQQLRSCLAVIVVQGALVMLCAISTGCGKAADSGSAAADFRGRETTGVTPTASSVKPLLETGDPANIQPDELKALLDGVPDSFRKNRSDLDLARDLGIHAWGIEFSGGPLLCWLDIEESGQKTMPARYPGPPGANFPAQAERGHIMIGLRPGAASSNPSGRSQRILQELGNPVDGISEVFILSGAVHSRELSADPQVPRLWASWTDTAFKEISRTEKVEGNGDVTLLAVQATEKQPPDGATPRKLTFALRARVAVPQKP